MNDVQELAALSGERVTPDPQFAVSGEVLDAVYRMGMPVWRDEDMFERWHCPKCSRGVILCRDPAGTRYRYLPGDVEGLLLAHLIQAHGWSRESVGE